MSWPGGGFSVPLLNPFVSHSGDCGSPVSRFMLASLSMPVWSSGARWQVLCIVSHTPIAHWVLQCVASPSWSCATSCPPLSHYSGDDAVALFGSPEPAALDIILAISLMPRRSALRLHRCVVLCSRLIISSVLVESTFPSLCLLAQPCLAFARWLFHAMPLSISVS